MRVQDEPFTVFLNRNKKLNINKGRKITDSIYKNNLLFKVSNNIFIMLII